MSTAFIFSGQGAQYPGMGKAFYDRFSAVREAYSIISEGLGFDVAQMCHEGTQEQLNSTLYTQPCVFAAEVAAMIALKEMGILPSMCAGFSLGEYAALVCSESISIFDGAKLIRARAEAMSKHQQGGMMAVLGMDAIQLENECSKIEGFVVPVNYNCPGQIVVAGENEALESLSARLKEQKIRAMKLKVSGAFHCKYMIPAAQELTSASKEVSFSDPQIPIYANVNAKPIADGKAIPGNLYEQCCSPVRWEDTIKNMVNDGADIFYECGPGKVLAGFNKRICPELETHVTDEM